MKSSPSVGAVVAAPPSDHAPPKIEERLDASKTLSLSSSDNGYFQFEWTASNYDSFDWIGLFASVDASDEDYVRSGVLNGNYQWVENGSSFVTNTYVNPGYQARYMRWDNESESYRSILRTTGFPEAIYSHNVNTRNWMSRVARPEQSLATLTIPGTHDSATYQSWVIPGVQTQGYSIPTQLAHGIRFLDIRCQKSGDELWLYHGPIPLGLELSDALDHMKDFLSENPSETILMSLKNDGHKDGDQALSDTFYDQYYLDSAYRRLFFIGNYIPTLEEVRGQIVLMRRCPKPGSVSGSFGLELSPGWTDNSADINISYTSTDHVVQRFNIQDNYEDIDTGEKESVIETMLDKAANGADDTFFMNFSSMVTPFIGPIPGYPWDSAKKVNSAMLDHINDFWPVCVRLGCIPMDWPIYTPDLISTLIEKNELILSEPEISDG